MFGACVSAFFVHTHNYPGRMSIPLIPFACAAAVTGQWLLEAPRVNRWLPWLLLIAAAIVYTWRLGEMPTYVSPDEAIIAVDAHSVATTGRDVHGTSMPLYFYIQVPKSERSGWFTPVIFYLSAAVQLVLPFSEWSIRIPSVIVGLTNLVLLFVLGRRLFGNTWIALMSAALLALSPAHYIFSRYALDYLYPVRSCWHG